MDEYEQYLQMMAQAMAGRQNQPEEDFSDMRYALMNQENQWEADPGMRNQMLEALLTGMGGDRLSGVRDYAKGLNMHELARNSAGADEFAIQPGIEEFLASMLRSRK